MNGTSNAWARSPSKFYFQLLPLFEVGQINLFVLPFVQHNFDPTLKARSYYVAQTYASEGGEHGVEYRD